MPRPRSTTPRNAVANVRLTDKERDGMEAAAAELGHGSLSEYIRFLHKHWHDTKPGSLVPSVPKIAVPSHYHRTSLGQVYHGNSRPASSRPCARIRRSHHDVPAFWAGPQKSYGNEDADEYCSWFRPFAEGFKRVLKTKAAWSSISVAPGFTATDAKPLPLRTAGLAG